MRSHLVSDSYADLFQARGGEGMHCYLWGPMSWLEHCNSGDSLRTLVPIWCAGDSGH